MEKTKWSFALGASGRALAVITSFFLVIHGWKRRTVTLCYALLWAVPTSRYFPVSQNSAILWLTSYCCNCGCQAFQYFFSFCALLEASWSAQVVYEIWMKHCHRILKSSDPLCLTKVHLAERKSKQKQWLSVIFSCHSQAVITKNENWWCCTCISKGDLSDHMQEIHLPQNQWWN